MKILYISYDGMTDPLGQSQVIPYLRGLVEHNHEIHLISCEKPARWATDNEKIAQIMTGAGIFWHPLSYTSRPPVLSTLMDVVKIKHKAKSIIKKHSIEVIHCRSYISALVGVWAKRTFGVSFVFDMRGFWADERVEGGIWRLSNPLYNFVYKYFKRNERLFLLNADYVVSLTEEARVEILSWFKEFQQPKIAVIPCCADLQHFSPDKIDSDDKIALRANLGIANDALVLSYLGSVGTWYLLDEMLAFFKVLQRRYSKAVFLFISTEGELILQKAKQLAVAESAIVAISASRAQVPLYISISDASVFFIKQSFSKKASSPTKMGELMAMGVPLICNDGVGDVGFIMKTSNAGILLPSCNSLEYEKAVEGFNAVLQLDKTHIQQMAHHHFSLEAGILMYNEIYCALQKR